MQNRRLQLRRRPPVANLICPTCLALSRATTAQQKMSFTLHASMTLNGNSLRVPRADYIYLLVDTFVAADHFVFQNVVHRFPMLTPHSGSGRLVVGSSSRPWLKPGGRTTRKKMFVLIDLFVSQIYTHFIFRVVSSDHYLPT